MKIIYKYPLPNSQKISLPQEAQILSVQYQGDVLCLWALVDPDAPEEERTFRVLGTGWDIEESLRLLRHLATVQEGPYVWHVFEET